MNRRIFLLGLAAFLSNGAVAKQAPTNALEVRIDQVSLTGQVTVSLHNSGKAAIKVWKNGTRWGSARWRLHHISNSSGELRTYYEDPYEITKGLPWFDEVSPEKPLRITLDLNNGWWLPRREGVRRLEVMWAAGDTVIAVYDVPISDEAQKYGVWHGVAAGMKVVE